MNKDPSKMYEFLEALNMHGHPERLTGKKIKSTRRDKKTKSPLYKGSKYKGSKKCDQQCIDCFLTFCPK